MRVEVFIDKTLHVLRENFACPIWTDIARYSAGIIIVWLIFIHQFFQQIIFHEMNKILACGTRAEQATRQIWSEYDYIRSKSIIIPYHINPYYTHILYVYIYIFIIVLQYMIIPGYYSCWALFHLFLFSLDILFYSGCTDPAQPGIK